MHAVELNGSIGVPWDYRIRWRFVLLGAQLLKLRHGLQQRRSDGCKQRPDPLKRRGR